MPINLVAVAIRAGDNLNGFAEGNPIRDHLGVVSNADPLGSVNATTALISNEGRRGVEDEIFSDVPS
jgi:hypothetical protein